MVYNLNLQKFSQVFRRRLAYTMPEISNFVKLETFLLSFKTYNKYQANCPNPLASPHLNEYIYASSKKILLAYGQ